MLDAYLAIGEIAKPQGVKGEVKLRPITADMGRFSGLERAFLESGGEYTQRGIASARVAGEAVFVRFEGVEDRDEAEKLRGRLVYVRREDAIELSDDENFIVDLIGCKGVDTDGREIGTLTDVWQPGGNDVYAFHGQLGEVLVPALKSVVLKVDVQQKAMLLDAARLKEVAVFDED